MLRTANQIRAGQSFSFSFAGPPTSTRLHRTLWNLLLLLLMCLIIMCSTAVLSYHLRLLSSLIRVTVGGFTSSFVQGHIAGSLWTGLPPGGDPFVHHGVTGTEDKHELKLSVSFLFFFFFLFAFPLIPVWWAHNPFRFFCSSSIMKVKLNKWRKDFLGGPTPISLWP